MQSLQFHIAVPNTQIHARQRAPHIHSTESIACITFHIAICQDYTKTYPNPYWPVSADQGCHIFFASSAERTNMGGRDGLHKRYRVRKHMRGHLLCSNSLRLLVENETPVHQSLEGLGSPANSDDKWRTQMASTYYSETNARTEQLVGNQAGAQIVGAGCKCCRYSGASEFVATIVEYRLHAWGLT
jgi:hypothetical protein